MNLPDDSGLPFGLTFDDLPLWMQQARRRVDWGLLLALLIGLVSVWPFVVRGGLPHGTALELYVYRTAELTDVVRQGVVYPRWAPNLMYGYGLPVFNYTAPGSLYGALLFQFLTEGTSVDGVRFVLVVGALLGAVGLYQFVRRRWGPTTGLVAVALYSLNPLLVFLLPYIYGDLALLLALQWLPLTLWLLDRLLYTGRAGAFLGWTLAFSSLLLVNDRTLPFFAVLLVCWLLWVGWFDRERLQRGRVLAMGWAGLLLGGGIAALFWLPALLERGQVIWQDYGWMVPVLPLRVAELFAPVSAIDFGAFNPVLQRTLGLTPWLLAGGGVIGLIVRWRQGKGLELSVWLFFPLWLVMALGGLASGTLDGLAPVLGLALVLPPLVVTACGVVIALGHFMHDRARQVVLALLLALPLTGAFPLLHPPDWPAVFGRTDAASRLHLELDEYSMGTIPPGEAVPFPAADVPLPSRTLLESYFVGAVDKVNRDALRTGQVDVVERGPLYELLQVRSSVPLDVPLYISAGQNWQARIDGEGPLPLQIGSDDLLQVHVPGGVHTVRVYLARTPVRQMAGLISGLSLLTAFVIFAWRLRRSAPVPDGVASPHLLTRSDARVMAAVVAVFLVLLPLVINAEGWFWRQSPRGVVLDAQNGLRRFTQAGVDILAYDLPQTVYTTGDDISLTLYWRAVRPLNENLQVLVTLADAATGQRLGQSYKRHVGGYPTSRWPQDHYLRDFHRFTVPVGTPPGTYLLLVELWRCPMASFGVCQPEERIPFYGDRGVSIGESLALPVLLTVQAGGS